MNEPVTRVACRCLVAGGGPAGLMLGFLLARAGVDVLVLEKHADFLRDFRGDTIHPSTLEVMHELGLLDEFLARPNQRVEKLVAFINDQPVTIADFSRLRVKCPFIAFMPQWEFLDFLAHTARRYPSFRLLMRAEVTELLFEGERVTGARATTPDGLVEISADLVVGADGRQSIVRARAGLEVEDLGAPMDLLWMRLPRGPGDPPGTSGRAGGGRILIMIDRGEYWQCAYAIPKGSADAIRARGLAAFSEDIALIAPFLSPRVAGLAGWDDVKLLTVRVDRLRRWYRAGLICIGDAAHAMSPIGGVGVNLAIQDAVAAANLLAEPLRRGAVTEADLRAVERRRRWPSDLTQRFQLLAQSRVVRPVLQASPGEFLPLPLAFRILARIPALARIPGRFIGIGVRPEHVATAKPLYTS